MIMELKVEEEKVFKLEVGLKCKHIQFLAEIEHI